MEYHKAKNGSDTVSIKGQTRPNDGGNKNKKGDESHGNRLDTLIRGKWWNKWNAEKIRYDNESHRWYLRLTPLHVKKIRAKVWQSGNGNDQ